MNLKRTGLVAAMLVAMGIIACKGDKGDPGAAGSTGSTGATGAPGVSTGALTGKLTAKGGVGPVAGVTVAAQVNNNTVGSTTSAADGTYSLTLPLGTYSIVFSGGGVTSVTVPGVTIIATGATLNQTFTYSPIVIDFPQADYAGQKNIVPVFSGGFGQTATVNASVTGATGAVTYAWKLLSGGPALGSGEGIVGTANAASIQFKTGTYAESIAPLFGFVQTSRPGFIALSAEQVIEMTSTLQLTVTDSLGYTQVANVGVTPATVTQPSSRAYSGEGTGLGGTGSPASTAILAGSGVAMNSPVGAMVIANDVAGGSYSWTATGPSGAVTLNDAGTRNAWFVPAAAGTYTLTNGSTVLTVNVGTYSGVTACGICHNGGPGGGQVADWQKSAHGNFYWNDVYQTPNVPPAGVTPPMSLFVAGVDGYAAGSHYSSSCSRCHTVGGDPTQVGGAGFADAVKSTGWTFPNPPAAGYWEGLKTANATQYNALNPFASIQCENCHGPVSITASGTHTPQISYDAGMCARCHDEPPNHTKYYEWIQSPHADFGTTGPAALSVGNSAHCGRCHTGQGFVTWLDEQQAGSCNGAQTGTPPASCQITPPTGWVDPINPGAVNPQYTTDYLTFIGTGPTQAQPQTCQVCHDPHTTTLRVFDQTQMLPAGFSVSGAGAGALCMMCHNTRNGLHNDGLVLAAFGAPHAPSQTDILEGQNAYFVGSTPQVSKHALVGDACVTCHVSLNDHTFAITDAKAQTLCANCHGSALTPDGTQLYVKDGLANLATTLNGVLVTALQNPVTNPTGAYTVIAYDANETPQTGFTVLNDTVNTVNVGVFPTAVVPTTYHGQPALTITLSAPVSVAFVGGAVSTSTISVRLADIKVGNLGTGGTVLSPGGSFTKAEWNYLLVSTDGSFGVHNPSFVVNVLQQSNAQAGSAP